MRISHAALCGKHSFVTGSGEREVEPRSAPRCLESCGGTDRLSNTGSHASCRPLHRKQKKFHRKAFHLRKNDCQLYSSDRKMAQVSFPARNENLSVWSRAERIRVDLLGCVKNTKQQMSALFFKASSAHLSASSLPAEPTTLRSAESFHVTFPSAAEGNLFRK